MRIFLLVLCAFLFSGCANLNSIYRPHNVKGGRVALVDAKQRGILTNRVEVPVEAKLIRDPATGKVTSTEYSKKTATLARFCAEPSPDVFSVLSSSLAAVASYSQTAEERSAALNLAAQISESGSTIQRTQTIQTLREMMYRLCERHMNGAIDDELFEIQAARDQRIIVSILAIEQLTNAVRPEPVRITATSTANAGADLAAIRSELEEARKLEEKKKEELEEKEQKLSEAEKKLADAKKPAASSGGQSGSNPPAGAGGQTGSGGQSGAGGQSSSGGQAGGSGGGQPPASGSNGAQSGSDGGQSSGAAGGAGGQTSGAAGQSGGGQSTGSNGQSSGSSSGQSGAGGQAGTGAQTGGGQPPQQAEDKPDLKALEAAVEEAKAEKDLAQENYNDAKKLVEKLKGLLEQPNPVTVAGFAGGAFGSSYAPKPVTDKIADAVTAIVKENMDFDEVAQKCLIFLEKPGVGADVKDFCKQHITNRTLRELNAMLQTAANSSSPDRAYEVLEKALGDDEKTIFDFLQLPDDGD